MLTECQNTASYSIMQSLSEACAASHSNCKMLQSGHSSVTPSSMGHHCLSHRTAAGLSSLVGLLLPLRQPWSRVQLAGFFIPQYDCMTTVRLCNLQPSLCPSSSYTMRLCTSIYGIRMTVTIWHRMGRWWRGCSGCWCSSRWWPQAAAVLFLPQ